MKLPRPLEKDIQKQIVQWLKLWGAVPVRVNSGAVRGEYKGKERMFRMNSTPGCSDILCVLPGGTFAAVECKRPGQKATPDQEAFLAAVRKAGGFAVVAHSVQELRHELVVEGYDPP